MVKTLKALLAERSLSLTKLAKMAGFQPATVIAIGNRSSDPRLETVLKLCTCIPCSLRSFAASLYHDVSQIPLDCEVGDVPGFVDVAKSRGVSLKKLAKTFGIDVDGVPDDINIDGIQEFAEIAKSRKVSLKTLATSFGVDVEGIPNDQLSKELEMRLKKTVIKGFVKSTTPPYYIEDGA